MKIIMARMLGYNISTPLDAVSRELEKLGHKLHIVESIDDLPADAQQYDFIFSAYESVTLLGEAIRQKTGLPHYAHMEWIPPWRIFDTCDPKEYGYTDGVTEVTKDKKEGTVKHYQVVMEAYLKADIRTISSPFYLDYLTKFCNQKVTAIERSPSVDVATMLKAKQLYSPKRISNRIVTLSRLVPNKRYDLLVKVMNQLNVKCKWVIIGGGPVSDFVRKELKNDKVDLKILGTLWGWERCYELLASTIYLGAWTGMPPIEAALLGCYPVVINPKVSTEVSGDVLRQHFLDSFPVIDEINIQDAGKQLEQLLEKQDTLGVLCKEIETKFLNNELGIQTSKQNATNIVANYEKYSGTN